MNSDARAKSSCEHCDGRNLKRRITTYPIRLGEKQINIGRVAVKECIDCHHLMPTAAEKEKIDRCFGTVVSLFDRHGISPI